MSIKISLTGDIGSGKSTISELLSKKLDARKYSTGNIIRDLARNKNMSVVDFNFYMEEHPEIDYEIDQGLVKMSDIDENIIIDSRMAWKFVQNTFKVYLSTAINVSAQRIHNDKRDVESFSSVAETEKNIKARKASENLRYSTKYNVDFSNLDNFDFVIDTSVASAETLSEYIIRNYLLWINNSDYAKCYMSSLRMIPRIPINESLAPLSLDLSSSDNYVGLVYHQDNFYILNNHNVVAYCIENNIELIPCRLTGFKAEGSSSPTSFNKEIVDGWANYIKEKGKTPLY